MRVKLSKYRQILLPSFILFFSFMPLSLLSAKEELTEIVKRITPSVVFITTYDREGEVIGYGSGFFISKDGDIITSRHVLIGVSCAEIKVAKEKSYPIMKIVAEDKAIESLKQAIRINPDYADAHYNLGLAYYKLGRYTKAIKASQQAIRISPDLAAAHLNLGVAYLMRGDRGFCVRPVQNS